MNPQQPQLSQQLQQPCLDIQPDNTVASNRIADARFAYGGTGDFDQANQMGWLARFFNSEWWPL